MKYFKAWAVISTVVESWSSCLGTVLLGCRFSKTKRSCCNLLKDEFGLLQLGSNFCSLPNFFCILVFADILERSNIAKKKKQAILKGFKQTCLEEKNEGEL